MSLTPERVRELLREYHQLIALDYDEPGDSDVATALEGWLRAWELHTELHQPFPVCGACGRAWPCPTHRELLGEEP